MKGWEQHLFSRRSPAGRDSQMYRKHPCLHRVGCLVKKAKKDDVIQDVLSVYLGNFQRVFPPILPYNMAKCCNTSIEIWSHEF